MEILNYVLNGKYHTKEFISIKELIDFINKYNITQYTIN